MLHHTARLCALARGAMGLSMPARSLALFDRYARCEGHAETAKCVALTL